MDGDSVSRISCRRLVIAPMMIAYLRKLKFGQQIITEYGPTWHKEKAGNTDYGRHYLYYCDLCRIFRVAFPYYTSGEYIVGNILPSAGLASLIVSTLLAFMGFTDDMVK